jgi:DNA polymerase I
MGLENVQLELVNSVELAGEFMRWLSKSRRVLAFDTETGGLDPEKEPLRLVQFGDREMGWAIPWDRWGGVALEAFKKYEGEFVGHNAKFDVRFLELHGGIRLPRERIHDTRLIAHILDPASSTALKQNAARFVDPKAAYASKVLDNAMSEQKWSWRTVPIDFEPYWAYGALDTVLTAHLFDVLHPSVEGNKYRDVYELERNVSWVLADMEARGALIDMDYTRAKAHELLVFSQNVAQWCQDVHGVQPGSNASVTDRLVALGVPMAKTTAGGNLSLDEEVLQEIIGGTLEDVDQTKLNEGQNLAYQVYARRKAEKIRGTYLDAFEGFIDSGNVVHPQINQLGARTGRMSMERPALQTLPRGRVVRDCFIPRPDHVLFSADFDGIEMRLLAHFAQDPALIEAINSGDIHTNTAQRVYGDPSITNKDPRRQIAKNVGFAKIYGAGPEKIAWTAGVSVDEAKAFLEQYDASFPGVRAFQTQVAEVAVERKQQYGKAFVHTPLGRMEVSKEDRDYALVNSLIQGTAADVFKEALVRLDEAGCGDFMLLPIHDEVIFDIPENDVDEVKDLIVRAMADDKWSVPITVGVDGPMRRWGEKYA